MVEASEVRYPQADATRARGHKGEEEQGKEKRSTDTSASRTAATALPSLLTVPYPVREPDPPGSAAGQAISELHPFWIRQQSQRWALLYLVRSTLEAGENGGTIQNPPKTKTVS